MSFHSDLLQQARWLAQNEPKRPRQSSLRRAVSAAYYALFHLLVDESTRLLVSGESRGALRGALARSYSHNAMKKAAQSFAGGTLPRIYAPALGGHPVPPDLRSVADAFIALQQARHEADYDITKRWTRLEALEHIALTEQAFTDWARVRSSAEADAFLVALLAQSHSQA
jgi:hypothetical protein